MKDLRQKVLEQKTSHGHTNEEIRLIVHREICNLQKQYRITPLGNGVIEKKFYSETYRAFLKTGSDETTSYFSELRDNCLLEETNIKKFINGRSKRIQNKTKDFFAVYCGFEGYNSFLADSKIERKENDTSNSNSKISITVNQHGKENTSIGEIKTDNLYL